VERWWNGDLPHPSTPVPSEQGDEIGYERAWGIESTEPDAANRTFPQFTRYVVEADGTGKLPSSRINPRTAATVSLSGGHQPTREPGLHSSNLATMAEWAENCL
jgi:hypothetical protein